MYYLHSSFYLHFILLLCGHNKKLVMYRQCDFWQALNLLWALWHFRQVEQVRHFAILATSSRRQKSQVRNYIKYICTEFSIHGQWSVVRVQIDIESSRCGSERVMGTSSHFTHFHWKVDIHGMQMGLYSYPHTVMDNMSNRTLYLSLK